MRRGKKIIVANWKSTKESKRNLLGLVQKIKNTLRSSKTNIIICPPFPYLQPVIDKIGRSNIAVGAQYCSSKDGERHTGEVNSTMLSEMDIEYCIVGHSERREAGETYEEISEEIETLLRKRVHPIICVGDGSEDKTDDKTNLLNLRDELLNAIKDISAKDITKCLIAYEPKWAIGGTSTNAIDEETLHQRVLYIRKLLKEAYGRHIAFNVSILYGGSVKIENIETLNTFNLVDGFLVGGASTTAEFIDIMLSVKK